MATENKTSNKNGKTTGKTTNKNTGKPSSRKPAAKGKKATAQQTAEQFRSLGVGLMLLGLLLGLWFLVLAVGVLLNKPTVAQAAADIPAAVANMGMAAVLLYLGYGLYSERKGRFDSWQVVGWCLFFMALAGLLHIHHFAGGFAAAMQVALDGFGGSICGFVACLPLFWLPSNTAQYIVLAAFLLLGLILAVDLQVFVKMFGALAAVPKNMAAAAAEKQEAARAAQAEKSADTEITRQQVMAKPQPEIKLPPVITEYSGRRFEETPKSDYDKVTVGQMLGDNSAAGPEMAGVLHYSRQDEQNEAERLQAQKQAAAAWANSHREPPKINIAGAPTPAETEPQREVAAAEEQSVVSAEKAAEKAVNEPQKGMETAAAAGNTAEKATENANENTNENTNENIDGDEHIHTELKRVVDYQLPPVSLMKGGITVRNPRINQRIMDDSVALENVLASFGVKTKVVEVVCGPAIIRYELQPAPGVKISRIVSLADDIALALAARGLRIEAPVPGKSVVGIEVAREETSPVYFKDVLASETFAKSKSKLSIAFGVDINGSAIVGNLADMPHLMIAGATGSGKSVCMNTLICSILYKAKPDEVKFIMVDPKKVELTGYVGLPHLGRPVVTDAKKASQVLKEVVSEMERRYLVFVTAGVKNFTAYNELPDVQKMPQIVVLIDELADLMMVASHDVEDSICRLAQMARAAGIHLVIATQRPSVDVITGLIKANIPSRIAFAVSSQIDSRTILDMGGAEKLLGKGDMLYFPIGMQKPLRVQGAFLTEEEIHDLVAYCKQQAEPEYLELPLPEAQEEQAEPEKDAQDELFFDACQQVITSGQASASSLQRRFRIGYNRAARLIETMQELGIVSAPEGNKRTVLMNMPTFASLYLQQPLADEQAAEGNEPNGQTEQTDKYEQIGFDEFAAAVDEAVSAAEAAEARRNEDL